MHGVDSVELGCWRGAVRLYGGWLLFLLGRARSFFFLSFSLHSSLFLCLRVCVLRDEKKAYEDVERGSDKPVGLSVLEQGGLRATLVGEEGEGRSGVVVDLAEAEEVSHSGNCVGFRYEGRWVGGVVADGKVAEPGPGGGEGVARGGDVRTPPG